MNRLAASSRCLFGWKPTGISCSQIPEPWPASRHEAFLLPSSPAQGRPCNTELSHKQCMNYGFLCSVFLKMFWRSHQLHTLWLRHHGWCGQNLPCISHAQLFGDYKYMCFPFISLFLSYMGRSGAASNFDSADIQLHTAGSDLHATCSSKMPHFT